MDVVIDVASTRTFAHRQRVLTSDGTVVTVGHDRFGEGMNRWTGSFGPVLRLALAGPFRRQLSGFRRSTPRADRPAHIARMLQAGTVRPVVDRTCPPADTVDALRYLTSGRAVGDRAVSWPLGTVRYDVEGR